MPGTSNSTGLGSAIDPAGSGSFGWSASPTRARSSARAPSGSPWEMWAGSPQPKWRISLRAMQSLQPRQRLVEHPPRRATRHEAAEARHPAQLLVLLDRHARAALLRRLQADLGLCALEDAGERRALDLLAPAPQLRAARLQHAEVGADRPALVGAQQLREAVPLHQLDALHARPPARQVVGIGDRGPQLVGRRRDDPAAADLHSSSSTMRACTS